MNIEKGGKHMNQLYEGPEIKLYRGSRTQGRSKNSSLLRIYFQQWRSQIHSISTKGEGIVSMTPYTKAQIRRIVQEWLEWRPTPLFILILPNFLSYKIHLPWRADMNINLSDHGNKETSITDIWDAWLRLYRCISPHDHPYGSVDWDSQGPKQWSPLVLLQKCLCPGAQCGCHYAWLIFWCVFLEEWESWRLLGLYPECLEIDMV